MSTFPTDFGMFAKSMLTNFRFFSCHLCRQILSQISECSPQGKINCGAPSEPKIIQNDFLLMHMLEFLDIHDKCRTVMPVLRAPAFSLKSKDFCPNKTAS